METHILIKKRINDFFGIDIDEPTRIQKYVEARMIYYWLCFLLYKHELVKDCKDGQKESCDRFTWNQKLS